MESSDLGNALITSGNGGLLETTIRPIILKKVDKYLVDEINDNEIQKLAKWALIIEKHYKKAMDIELTREDFYQLWQASTGHEVA